MSLLLDALKKAAQEKQNADSEYRASEAGDGLSLEPVTDLTLSISSGSENDKPVLEELELQDRLYLEDVSSSDELSEDVETAISPDYQDQRISPTPSNVSDEALQLLIHKTNDAYKKSRIVTWGGVAVGAVVMLLISGVYFYSNMASEIESMHRKHQIALATLKTKTRIEENLTSLAIAPDTGEIEKDENSTLEKVSKATKTASNQSSSEPGSGLKPDQTFSVQRADKRDPVSERLERGWMAYQKKDYEASMREYSKVLDEEPDNHDALLGVAAVSLQRNEADVARDIYIKLLEKDPRDPHAHAGLANIAQTGGASLNETRLKQLIEFRPDDSHLQFALGNLYVRKKSWPEAQQAFFNALKGDSSNPDYAYNLAVSLDQLGKHKEAKDYYEDSLKLASGKNISFSPDAVKSRLAYLGAIKQP